MCRIKKLIRDKGGGACVPTILPLLLVVTSIIVFFTLDPIGQGLIQKVPWQIVKMLLFSVIMIFASYCDLKENEVPNWCSIALILVGLIGVTWNSVLGCVVCLAVFYVVALIGKLGGADLKIATGMGFVLGLENALISLMIGLSISIIVEIIIAIFKKEKINTRHYPLVPYMALGCFTVILKGII